MTNQIGQPHHEPSVVGPGTVWCNGSMATRVEELPDDKVRLTVDVPGADVHSRGRARRSDLASSVKIPGFRKGKVPMPVLRSHNRQRAPPERSDREPYFGLVSGTLPPASGSVRSSSRARL